MYELMIDYMECLRITKTNKQTKLACLEELTLFSQHVSEIIYGVNHCRHNLMKISIRNI